MSDSMNPYFGLPVVFSTLVPRDEVWLRSRDEMVKVIKIANEPESETVRALREHVAALTEALVAVVDAHDADRASFVYLHPGKERLWRERAHITKARAALAGVKP
jgi:TRAP-type uncharacterized transport system substrate-binding protein